jgi:hypothetical protein
MKVWIENRQEMEQILSRALVGRLGVSTDDGPYVVPLNFAYDNGRIYFHTGLEGRKLDAIRGNPRVCFEVDELLEIVPNEMACMFTAYYHSVIAWGTARLLDDDADKLRALNLLLEKYGTGASFEPPPEHTLAIVSVCEIAVDTITGKSNLPEPPG